MGVVTAVAGAGALVAGVGGWRTSVDMPVFIAPVSAEDNEAVNRSGSMVIAEVVSASVVDVNDPTTAGVTDEDAGVDSSLDGLVPASRAEVARTSEIYFQK